MEKFSSVKISLTDSLSPSDPEVHIGLENLHHFPAFGSPPQYCNQPVPPDFIVAPPSPLSSSPSSGKKICLDSSVVV